MTSDAEKSKLPTWAKVLIGLVVFGIVAVIALGVGAFFFVQNIVKQAQDPAVVSRTAHAIADIPEPLPKGYKYSFAFGMAGINTLVVQHEPDQQMLILISKPQKEDVDADKLVNVLFEAGIKTPGQSGLEGGKGEKVKLHGTETIGGESMPYIIGTMADKKGTKFDGMVGCVVSKTKDKTVLIYGMQPGGSPYNFEATKEFLKAIRTF
ncbi:MAG: hypothetical protein HY711_03630 [Candidatus Melainabacteria bacterium]|nr:hypothetical protein [Candidatus Melainabacteria bacterium]